MKTAFFQLEFLNLKLLLHSFGVFISNKEIDGKSIINVDLLGPPFSTFKFIEDVVYWLINCARGSQLGPWVYEDFLIFSLKF